MKQRLHERENNGSGTSTPARGLPSRLYVHHQANPEFQPTRQANRV
jgi:hypothetical protein